MPQESIYNIFLVMEGDICTTTRYVVHYHDFSHDNEAIEFLKNRVEPDLQKSIEFKLQRSFTRSEYYSYIRIGQSMRMYDELFVMLNAPLSPLCVTTIVIDGKVRVDDCTTHNDPNIYLNSRIMGHTKMDDWLLKYTKDDKIDLPQLIHDDYFKAINLTFNNKLYVSSMKLLLSCIDSISYIEFGNTRTPAFITWLKTYADLTPLGVTPDEVWELRNGLLHMTNLYSRRIRSQHVRQVSFNIGGQGMLIDETYYFSFSDFIEVFSIALSHWFLSYNETPDKFATFVERYDETISDNRIASRPV